jgi:kexin
LVGWQTFSIFFIFLLFISCKNGNATTNASGLLWISPLAGSDSENILSFSPKSRAPEPCTGIDPSSDPLFPYQWHLVNTGQILTNPNQAAGTPGLDLRVDSVWTSGNFGQNVRVSVVDDGLDLDHEDLTQNATMGSRNFLSPTNGLNPDDPGGIAAPHGTSVAGIISARGGNGKGLSGVAPCSAVLGYNFLSSPTSVHLTMSLSNRTDFEVSNNSWGSEDGSGLLGYPTSVFRDALLEGVRFGRNGKGNVYIWAGGNGRRTVGIPPLPVDNANYDGYSNTAFTIAVAGLTNTGDLASYSEIGSNIWISGLTGRDSVNPTGISTVDLSGNDWGYNPGGVSPRTTLLPNNFANRNYTNNFNGTSAAAPTVSGVVALILSKNPNLSFRDIKWILASTARKIDPLDGRWVTNSAGFSFNPLYGFGLVDASAALDFADSWTSLGGYADWKIFSPVTGYSLGTVGTVATEDFQINVAGSNISKLEYVEIILDIEHLDPGKMEISLVPAGGNPSVLYEEHACFSPGTQVSRLCNPIQGFRFGSAQYLGESPDRIWTLRIRNSSTDRVATIKSWRLRFYGH